MCCFLLGLRTALKKLLCRKSPGKSVVKSIFFIYNESETLNGTGLFTYIWGSLESVHVGVSLLKWWVSPTTMGFPTKNDDFVVPPFKETPM